MCHRAPSPGRQSACRPLRASCMSDRGAARHRRRDGVHARIHPAGRPRRPHHGQHRATDPSTVHPRRPSHPACRCNEAIDASNDPHYFPTGSWRARGVRSGAEYRPSLERATAPDACGTIRARFSHDPRLRLEGENRTSVPSRSRVMRGDQDPCAPPGGTGIPAGPIWPKIHSL